MTRLSDVERAKKAFKRCQDWEAKARANFIEDIKFGNGDSYNKFQWPAQLANYRETTQRPALTINKTQVHCLQIINDARQNKTSIQVRPVGDAASADAANVLEGIIRHIEYRSNAQQAYDAATWFQVFGGWGYIRVHVDYADESSFDQDISIVRVPNPLNVYLDPDIKEYDGSDARFGFVFEDLPRAEAKAKYGRYVEDIDDAPLDEDGAWDTKDHVRVAEWFERTEKADTLIALATGETVRKSELDPEAYRMAKDQGFILNERPIVTPEIVWRLIIGSKVVEKKPWLGRYIPIVPVIGQETVIDHVMDRQGHVRCLIDAQRMYNYNTSGAVEAVAMQSRAPWMAPLAAIDDMQDIWASANTSNPPVLPYKHVDEAGTPIPAPQRIEPPRPSQGYVEGMQIAQQEMMMASGQYQAVMGAPSNETSGKAINARQRQGDNATYHFIDHLASGIRQVGRIILDLIPKVYDVPRVLQVLGRDDRSHWVQVDPNAAQGFQQAQDPDADDYNPQKIMAILNPSVGKFDVQSDVGPSYGTQRQETFNAMTQLLTSHQDLFPMLGDIWAKAADFEGAEEIAKRIEKMRGEGDPKVTQLQQLAQQGAQEIQQLHAALQAANQKLEDQARDLDRKDYEAETNRMKAVGAIDPEALKPVLREVISQAIGQHIGPLMDQHAAADQARMPAPEPEMVGNE